MKNFKFTRDQVARIAKIQEEWEKVEQVSRKLGITSGTFVAWGRNNLDMESWEQQRQKSARRSNRLARLKQ